ncbi:MgtC/SapB family protein [Desertivirga brevis]|uniref:MgtC/SapB family protein n=1 Tax=Desertivirga brevis TaxID=2810310 RepID=UPI001A960BDC|nr:MgtC/SapB family protein [Pedobacter sp. SYSU D00873]
MEFQFEYHDLLRILISIACGSIIGFEREYKNKNAGFRTLILICLGSTIFTIVSQRSSNTSDDRIAANIITGIGFIGAGVIFKDGLSVKGLTTAAVIWVVAALGMVIGTFHYSLSIILTLIVLVILSLFNKIEMLIDFLHHQRKFKVIFIDESMSHLESLDKEAVQRGLQFRQIQLTKCNNKIHLVFEVSGRKKLLADFNRYLIESHHIADVMI